MNHAAFTLAAGLILAGVAIGDDLPPGVLLLSRVKNHTKEELQHLPNISCLETVQREYQPAKGKMRPLDTVRLEFLPTATRSCSHRPETGGSRSGIPSAMRAAACSAMGFSGST
jgi:hypothetical protein